MYLIVIYLFFDILTCSKQNKSGQKHCLSYIQEHTGVRGRRCLRGAEETPNRAAEGRKGCRDRGDPTVQRYKVLYVLAKAVWEKKKKSPS